MAERAKSIVRDLDPTNQLTFFRMKSESHEVAVNITHSNLFRREVGHHQYDAIVKSSLSHILKPLQVLVAPEENFIILVLQHNSADSK